MEYRFGLNISYRIGNSHLFYDIHIVLIRCYFMMSFHIFYFINFLPFSVV